MRTLFRVRDILPLVEHAKAAKEHRKTYGQEKAGPALHFVHDHGVYLMSNGIPHMPASKNPEHTKVVYANKCDPDKDEDWWENARALVGGDDFIEELPIKELETHLQSATTHGFKWFYVEITEETMAFGIA